MKCKPHRYRGLTIYAICMNLMIFVSIQLCEGSSMEDGNMRTLSRRRRYLIFPEGSSLQIVYDTYYPVVDYTNLLLVGITGALAWELPTEPVQLEKEFKETNKIDRRALLLRSDDVEINNHGNTTPAKSSTTSNNYYGDDKFQHSLRDAEPMNEAETMSNFYNELINGRNSSRKTIFPYGYRGYSHHSIHPTFRKRSTLESTIPTAEGIFHRKLHRTSRYKLYEHLEKFIDAAGHDGKDCIRKALCETGQIKGNVKRRSFLGEVVRAIFSLPDLQVVRHENLPSESYETAYKETKNCTRKYPKCSQLLWKSPFH